MQLEFPDLSLVVLIGCSGSGKSTFARKHFAATEILSSDYFRGLVSNDENAQDATADAFDALRYVAAKRLARGLLTVVDATNVQPESRRPLVELAREFDVLPVAVVLDLPGRACQDRNAVRPDRQFGPHVVRNQSVQLRRSMRGLPREGFRHVFTLSSQEQIDGATVVREPLWNNRRGERGPFDIIGDVHGCHDELILLLGKLGYAIDEAGEVTPPPGRRAVFLGDLVDRGPKVPQVLRLVMKMVAAGTALCVPGNHDVKLMRKLRGKDVQLTHGLAESILQLEQEPAGFREAVADFIDKLVSHYVLDGGRLVVAHAGMKEQYQGRGSGRVREFALYGETTGETDEFGLPARVNWAAEYRGAAKVVYGHTPVPHAEWLNGTMNVDTGCVFGGSLTALRYPEEEIVSVPALRTYAEPAKPFLAEEPAAAAAPTAQQANDDVLDLDDVVGKRIVQTALMQAVTVREENATAALEVMSRFAADPRWLIYLPPTMSPTEASRRPGLLEHPADAFAYYRAQGVGQVVCQEKHMGSRAVVIVCRDDAAARRRFGVAGGGAGVVLTRTGRRFFDDRALEAELLDHVRRACDTAGFWDEFASDWFCLDCELMPWSAKAQELLVRQYAPVGSAAAAGLSAAVGLLERTTARAGGAGGDAGALLDRYRGKRVAAERYVAAYRAYCWPVRSVADLRLAPFHLLASEGKVHVDRDHLWHMSALARLCPADDGASPLIATRHRLLDLTDPAAEADAVRWWTDLTAAGGEGMVVKPLSFVVRGPRGLVQPAVKCRGPEYMRIIYGPEYDAEENLSRLRNRRVAAKRALALREFALGVESLQRFVRREPLRRVHECAFAVLALESEPVDARL